MSATIGLRIVPRTGIEVSQGGVRTDPIFSPLFDFFDSVGIKPLREPSQEERDLELLLSGDESHPTNKAVKDSVRGFFNELVAGSKNKDRSGKPRSSAPSPSAPSSGGNGKKPVKPGDFKSRKPSVKASDFKTAAKIAAGGAAAAGAGLAINEAAKELGDTLNDAVGTIGEVAENAAESIGKGTDAITDSVRETLQPIFDLFGITDPETQKSIASLLLIGGIVGASLLVLYFVVKKK